MNEKVKPAERDLKIGKVKAEVYPAPCAVTDGVHVNPAFRQSL